MSGSITSATDDEFMTCAEVAPLLRCKPGQVADLCRTGRLRATRPMRAWLIRRADVDTFLADASNQPVAS